MSREQAQPITLEEALEQLQLMESHLKQLQSIITELETRIAQLAAVEDAISRLSYGDHEALVPLDARGTVLVHATLKRAEKVVVHAGLNLFVEVGTTKALEFIRNEKASLSKTLDAYRQEYVRLAQYYSALRSAVESALQQAQRVGQQ